MAGLPVTLTEGNYLAVVSDTHGDAHSWQRAALYMDGAEAVIHSGDLLYHGPRNKLPAGYNTEELVWEIKKLTVPLLWARGNCDSSVDETVMGCCVCESLAFWWRGRKILAQHGDNPEGFRRAVEQFGADLAVSGHTHIPVLRMEERVMYLNPGSTSIPRGGYGASMALVGEYEIVVLTLDGEVIFREKW